MNIQLKKGVMEIVVLSMLRRKDYYGYELVTEISKYIEMSEGTKSATPISNGGLLITPLGYCTGSCP